HRRFGVVARAASDDRKLGLAMSAGGAAERIDWRTKGDPAVPNEDACCIVDDGERVMLAVADAHFGHRPSHVAIADVLAGAVPRDPAALEALVAAIARRGPADDAAATALAIAVVGRGGGQGFGGAFGDATVAAV